jgi:1-acyl-sn-glycerol-3-phosphate acyltransferase
MIFTVIWWLQFWFFMILSIPAIILFVILSIPPLKPLRYKFMGVYGPFWSKLEVSFTGSKITVIGKENIPDKHDYCVVSNHQSMLDIPVIMAVIPSTIGFIAKKELAVLPIIGWWMQALGCALLDRSDRRQAIKVMETAAKRIKSGHPMVIFPEGTRSKGGPIIDFKQGALRLAISSGTRILPITLQDTYKVLEANNFMIKGAEITVTIHPPIELSELSEAEVKNLSVTLNETIKEPFSK